MEALYSLKFWKSTAHNRDQYRPSSVACSDYYEFEDDDSFFELELTVPDFDSNESAMETDSNRFDNKNQNLLDSELKFHDKRKILPIQSPNSSSFSKPQFSPKFQVLMFQKSKSTVAHDNGDNGGCKKKENKLFTVKLKLTKVPILSRDYSSRKQISEESLSEDPSKIFYKEVMHKYLKLFKPFYVSRRHKEKPEFSETSSSSSPATCASKKEKHGSIQAGIRVVCKRLGKSKSEAAACTALPSSVTRRDDSLVSQQDGVLNAILHCKNSFNSSSCRESSSSSRIASDPADEIRISK